MPQHEQRAAAVGVEADDQPEHDQHDPDEHAQLDERERVPRRLRPLVAQRRGPARRAGGRCGGRDAALRGARGCGGPSGCQGYQVANGQPEEILTCHQPASMPTRPRRGRDVPVLAAGLADVRVA